MKDMGCETPGSGDESLITNGVPKTARESVELYFGVVKKYLNQPEISTKVVGVLMAAYSPLGLPFAIVVDAALRRKGCDKTSAEK